MAKIKSLEKDLYYYKVKTRKLKDQLKDFTNDVSMDPGEMFSNAPLIEHQILESGMERSNNGSGEDIHFPPVVMNQKTTYRMTDVQQNMEHQQQLQVITSYYQDSFLRHPYTCSKLVIRTLDYFAKCHLSDRYIQWVKELKRELKGFIHFQTLLAFERILKRNLLRRFLVTLHQILT